MHFTACQCVHFGAILKQYFLVVLTAANGEEVSPLPMVSDSNSHVAQAMRRRIQQSLALAARCTQLENEKSALARDNRELSGKLAKAQADLSLVQQRTRAGGEPQAHVLEQLNRAEVRAQEAEQQLHAARLALSDSERQLSVAVRERSEVKQDLERLLEERKGLDTIKQAVMSALQNQQ